MAVIEATHKYEIRSPLSRVDCTACEMGCFRGLLRGLLLVEGFVFGATTDAFFFRHMKNVPHPFELFFMGQFTGRLGRGSEFFVPGLFALFEGEFFLAEMEALTGKLLADRVIGNTHEAVEIGGGVVRTGGHIAGGFLDEMVGQLGIGRGFAMQYADDFEMGERASGVFVEFLGVPPAMEVAIDFVVFDRNAEGRFEIGHGLSVGDAALKPGMELLALSGTKVHDFGDWF
jgi:hypothetical protein